MGLVATSTRNLRDCRNAGRVFVVTNHTEDVALVCDTDTDNAIADVLGSLIQELIEAGILNGTVTDH